VKIMDPRMIAVIRLKRPELARGPSPPTSVSWVLFLDSLKNVPVSPAIILTGVVVAFFLLFCDLPLSLTSLWRFLVRPFSRQCYGRLDTYQFPFTVPPAHQALCVADLRCPGR